MICRRNADLPCLVLLCGGLIGVVGPTTVRAAGVVAPEPAPPVTAPDAVSPTPTTPAATDAVSGSSSPPPGSPPTAGAPAAPSGAPSADSPVPEPPTTAPSALAPAATEPEPAHAAIPPEPQAAAGEPIPVEMLDTSESAKPAPKPTAPRTVQYDTADPEQVEAMLAAQYRQRFRDDGLGARLNITARLQFANIGSADGSGVGGRMGGASIDVGPAWNRVSVAGTLSAYGGRVYLPEETGAEMNALIGGGPTLGYGRLALLGKGFLDLRVGYHFYYAAVGERRGGPALVATQSDGGVVLTQTENLLPHGPRVRMDLGLLSQANHKRFHAFGLSMGYQGLVHSLRGELPVTHMLTLGIAYWMG